jgi:hypothetical protein
MRIGALYLRPGRTCASGVPRGGVQGLEAPEKEGAVPRSQWKDRECYKKWPNRQQRPGTGGTRRADLRRVSMGLSFLPILGSLRSRRSH